VGFFEDCDSVKTIQITERNEKTVQVFKVEKIFKIFLVPIFLFV
jgi:hypothetical protein